MPPFRPITRTFPLALSNPVSARSTPLIYSITAQPRSSLPANAQAGHAFSNSAVKKSGAEPHYDPPTGWLWGVPPGEKRESEGWEKLWVWGFWGSLGVAVVAYAYKPDTSKRSTIIMESHESVVRTRRLMVSTNRIQTWALEEARRRLEAEGILPDPDTKST